ncbi:sodium- and chloride-dependent taurine transporter-like [Gigantopelta aegis]|uniref:sodium- and chloride-dependent taurine transporter-like n=1 Tax=Gigantopelta aegis TaxID=1735272 RepID=UPI001B88D3F3|nr:sodium- and chloride-dependent taurine transporter-like [Gigantopelta aegis]XP_041356929.1 sodium- and chloride-dependent taurine transporter-like [Gigantopelta aegis]
MTSPKTEPAAEVLVNGQTPGWNVNADPASSDGTSSSGDPNKGKIKERETWSRKIDFLLACIGFSVGLGNVWRFPFLCYRNGGGAFLIPYFIAVLLGGIPVFFLEVSLGQFMSEGGIGPWKICPLFQGVGYASAVIVFLLNCDYNIILAWAFYYLFSSFTSVLPWSNCDNEWNTPECTTFQRSLNATRENSTANVTIGNISFDHVAYNLSSALSKVSEVVVASSKTKENILPDPVTEFWERKVLQLSSDVGEPGTIKWDLALCLLLAWIVVYFCIWKGIKSSGKVMYFTATSPYILMFVLLIRGMTLDGAMDGIHYYLVPDWGRLLDPQVWVDAGTQIFFSYSISLGTLTALGSYNKFHHNSFRDTLIFAVVNSATSLLSGFVIFSILGFMAKQQNVSVANVAESGPGLAFIAYPEAVSQMPVAPLWSILFFSMIILLGLDSQFVGVEGFVTAVVDMYPTYIRKGRRREILIGVICLLCFLIGLSMVTQGGMYVFQLFDYYSASRIVLVVAFFECIVVAYIYGINRFYDNLEMMFGFRINKSMWICWSILTPIFTVVIFILGCISYSELTYNRKTVTYEYPSWAIGIGWTMASASIIFIPGIMLKRIVSVPGSLKERIVKLIRPRLKRHQIRANEDLSLIDIIDYDYETTNSIVVDGSGKPCLATQLLATEIKDGDTQEIRAQCGENNV